MRKRGEAGGGGGHLYNFNQHSLEANSVETGNRRQKSTILQFSPFRPFEANLEKDLRQRFFRTMAELMEALNVNKCKFTGDFLFRPNLPVDNVNSTPNYVQFCQ